MTLAGGAASAQRSRVQPQLDDPTDVGQVAVAGGRITAVTAFQDWRANKNTSQPVNLG